MTNSNKYNTLPDAFNWQPLVRNVYDEKEVRRDRILGDQKHREAISARFVTRGVRIYLPGHKHRAQNVSRLYILRYIFTYIYTRENV